MAAPPIQIDGYSPYCRRHLEHQTSIVDDLLFEIYDRWHDGRHDSFESDTFTECSSTSEVSHWRRNSIYSDTTHSGRLNHSVLETQSLSQLRRMVSEMQHRINSMSSRLVRQLKRRDRRFAKLQHNCDLVTAIVQAASQKRRIDTRMKFSLEPPPGESAFDQWKDAMKAVARLPMGIPDSFRRKVWLSLADNHIKELRVDWNKTMRFAFNERSNPDDNNLGMQIVKDLHRTGCSGFSGQDNDEDRAVLKRVLLGYARWNKAVGYCQGFNVIAALLLEVMDRKEDDALKVMIYLIDHVLPESYYANNLRALSVDMAVFRDLLRVTFPKLSRHLDYLQHAAQDQNTGACYEPPLTNVFTMQWFLTMFATCLPKDIVLRVWDSILLEGSEILLRTALAIWGKLSRKIQSLSSADEFYSLMGILTQDMMDGKIFDADSLIKFIYNCAPFPMQQLPELREKYTYNIRPFTSAASGNKKSTLLGNMLPSDEDDLDEEDLEAITCFTGIMPGQVGSGKNRDGEGNGSMADISMVGPGAYGMGSDSNIAAHASALSERMSTDISSLKKQYHRLKQRQNQAHIIIAAASAKRQARVKAIVPKIETPTAMNHLYVGKHSSQASLQNKNRYVTASPRMVYPKAITVPHFLQEGKKQVSPSHKGKTQDMSPTEPVSPPKHKESPSKVVFNEQVDTCNDANTFCAVNEDTNNSNTSGNTDKEVEETEDKVYDVTCLVNKDSETERLCDEHEDIKVGVTPESNINRNENVEDLTEENSVHEITAKDTHEENRQDRNPILQIEGQQNEIQREDSEAVKILPIDIEEREKSDSEDSGIIDNSEFQNALDLGEDIEDEIYIRNACGRIEIPEERTDSEAKSDIVKDSRREIGGDVEDGPHNNDNHTCLCGDMNSEIDRSNNSHTTINTIDSALSSKDIQSEETILHSEKEDGDSFHQSQMVEQVEILKQTRNIKSDSDIYCERAPEINPPMESQGTPLKSCLKSSRSIGNSGRSEGGNSRKMKLPKEKIITLTEYAKSKRKISSSSQESGSPKHFTDSDTGSVFSPDENNSSKSFTYTGQGERSVSFDSKMPSGLKPLTSKKPFNPFPVKHFNENRARTGIKLGIYKSSTFNELEKQSKRRPLWSK